MIGADCEGAVPAERPDRLSLDGGRPAVARRLGERPGGGQDRRLGIGLGVGR